MTELLFTEAFGANAVFTPASKIVQFDLNDFTDANFTIGSIDNTNIDDYTARIIWAILNKIIAAQPDSNNEADRGIFITNQGKRTATRNGIAQFAFSLSVTAYTADNLGVTLSENDIV